MVRELSEVHGLTKNLIYYLVERGQLTPQLDTHDDNCILTFLANTNRNQDFVRHLLSRIPKDRRKYVMETADLSKRDRNVIAYIKQWEGKSGKPLTAMNILASLMLHEHKPYNSENLTEMQKVLLVRIKKVMRWYRNQRYNAKKKEQQEAIRSTQDLDCRNGG